MRLVGVTSVRREQGLSWFGSCWLLYSLGAVFDIDNILLRYKAVASRYLLNLHQWWLGRQRILLPMINPMRYSSPFSRCERDLLTVPSVPSHCFGSSCWPLLWGVNNHFGNGHISLRCSCPTSHNDMEYITWTVHVVQLHLICPIAKSHWVGRPAREGVSTEEQTLSMLSTSMVQPWG